MRVRSDRAPRWLWIGCFVVGTALDAPRAQDAPARGVQAQIDDLVRRNEALEARVTELEAGGGDAGGMIARFGEVTATFNVFGDVGFAYDNPEDPGHAEGGFLLGSVDFFANVQLGDRFRVLSESVLAKRGSSDAIAVDQERLWAMWTVSDLLYVKVGTEHSPVSRWNQLYHHGHWLETSITRPYTAAFEGDGGIIAMHATGVELGGHLQPGVGGLDWFLAGSNGRGLEATDKQRSYDRDNGKKIDAGIAIQPTCVPGLRIGLACTFDDIPASPTSTVPGRSRSIAERVYSGSINYRLGDFDVIGEYAVIDHDVRATRATTHHHSGYLQLDWRAGAFTPFGRFDYRTMDMGDPFYVSLDRDLDAERGVLGVRYDATENLAVKFEVGLARGQQRGGGGVQDVDSVSGGLQIAWVF